MWVRFPLAWFLTNYPRTLNLNQFLKLKNTRPSRTRRVRYSLNFKSIIAPSSAHSSTSTLMCNPGMSIRRKSQFNRLLVKQSYLLVTWFYLLSQSRSSALPKFFVKPLKQSRFTIAKAPMAHKTFSQEQYLFRFYSINVSYVIYFPHAKPLSLNESLYLIMSLRSSSWFCETNLFLLQRYNVFIPVEDQAFLKVM